MNKAAPITVSDSAEKDLVLQIRKSETDSDFVSTTLRTDERVIARVTDGIYRRPGSALRELISNAYDADATRVVIKTDAPRFERITVEDNGHPNECQLATAAVGRVKNRKCVDTILRNDPKLMSSMVEETAELLALARYDIEKYRAWLQK